MPKVSVITPTIRTRGLEILEKCLREQTFQDFEWLIEPNVHKSQPDLNAALNRMIKRSRGEIIVFLQDFIKIPKDGIEQFVKALEKEKAFYTAPVNKTEDETFTLPVMEYDWRQFRKDKQRLDWKDWEIDWAATTKELLYDVGGFDEELDKHWGFDNVNIGLRLDIKGHKIYNLDENEALGYLHNIGIKHPFIGKRNPIHHNMRLDEIRRGLVVDFLK